jgi:AsmA protein
MTRFKFLSLLAAGIVALLGVALIAVWLSVDPNNYKAKIASTVKQSTGRDLKLSGDIKLSVFPWVSLELGPASLGNPQGFGNEPFLSLTHASVRVKLLPLLRKRLEVARLEVEGLDVRLLKNAQGKGNWQDPESSPEAQAKADAVHTGAGQLLESIANIQVRSGRVSYAGITVDNIKVETGSLTADQHIPVSAAFDVHREPGEQMSLSGKFDMSQDVERTQLLFSAVNLSGTLDQRGDGRPAHWELSTPMLAVNPAQQSAAATQYALSFSSAHLTGSVEAQHFIDDLSVSAQVTLAPVLLREIAPRLGFALPATRDPKALSQVSATFGLRYDAKGFGVSLVQARLDDTTVQGNFKLLADSGAIQFDLAADQLDVDRYRGPESGPPDRGVGASPAANKDAKPLDVHGTLTLKSAHVAKRDITDVKITVAAKDKVIHLYPLEAQLDGGRYSGNITWDAQGAIPTLSMDEHLAGIDMARFLANTAGKGRLSGRASINLKATARGADADADLRTLNGNLDADLANGAFEGIDVAYELSLAQALLNKSAQPASTNTGRTKFETFKTSLQIANGIAQTHDLTIASQALKVTGQGSVNLPTKAVDFRLLAGILTAPNRNTEIPLKVGGTYAALSVKPDIEGLAKDQLKQKLQDVLKKNGLQGLFSK